MSQQIKKIDFINIDCDSNYFDTNEQVVRRNTFYFSDRFSATKISGSQASVGHFSTQKTPNNLQTTATNPYPTSSVIIDASGNSRKILSSDIDMFASSSLDSYKNGVEITQDKHWIAGLTKITAGTPGHLQEFMRYGIIDVSAFSLLHTFNTSLVDKSGQARSVYVNDLSLKNFQDQSGNERKILSSENPADRFTEIEPFDPVAFVSTGGDMSLFTYPIVTKSSNQSENYVLDGVIEPLTIRPVVSNFSINVPFEPHAVRGDFGNGNTNTRLQADQVFSVDYFTPKNVNKTPYLDAVDMIGITTDSGESVFIGTAIGYFSNDVNVVPSFEDAVYPRGEAPSDTYTTDLIDALNMMKPGGTTYVNRKEGSGNCGFVNEDAVRGVESIVYSNIGWGSNRDNRRRKRTIFSLRDSESFIHQDSKFNDTNTVHFLSQSIEYPSMAPVNYNGPLMNSTVQSEIYKSGAIQILISGSIKPGNFDTVFYDSILSAKKRLGTL